MNHRRITIMIGLALMVSGCGKPSPDDDYVRPDQITDFHVLFGKSCSGCHGMDGQLGPAPPINDPVFQAIISDEQLTSIVSNGRHGTRMPAFEQANGGSLTAEQVQIIVNGIREEWAGKKAALEMLPTYSVSRTDPAGLKSADVSHGQQVFASVCSDCHGDRGQGGAEAGPIASNALGRLMSDQLLRRIVITGRPDLGMPNFVELGEMTSIGRPMNDQEISDVVAYVRLLQSGADAEQNLESENQD